MKHLHITGCRRSGTTLLFEMIAACFRHDDHCEHEQSVFVPIDIDGNRLYLSKKPSDVTHIHEIFRADPNLYLIYVRRDPRAVITSIHPTRSDIYYASFERWLRYEWAVTPLLQHPRFHLVAYEQLVTEPDKVQAELKAKFSFLEPLHPFSEFHDFAQTSEKAQISLKGLRPISKDSINAWQQHLPRIRFQLDRYPELKQVMRKYGYEANDDWLVQLEDVKPKTQTYGEKLPGWLKRQETNLRFKLKSKAYLQRRQ
ncbi:MAG: hypothetical protein ACI82A_002349 [Candidatus Azotimanducaceae bacterium]|jgi:hypothetical protein